jgi:hypothetical protein
MRALLSAVVLLMAARPALAEETWEPITVDGVDYEVRLPVGPNGEPTFRMPPGRLDRTLESLGRRVARLAGDLEGANLPSEVFGAPDAIFGKVTRTARAMGPDLVFSSPPRLDDPIGKFSFNDGKRLVSFMVSSTDPNSITQLVDVVFQKRVAGAWQVESRQTLILDRKKESELADERVDGRALEGAPGSPWVRAFYSESLGTAKGRQRPLVELEYVAMERRGQWVGSELRRGQGGRRFVLRSLEGRFGDPAVTQVTRADADRLKGLAKRTFRLPTSGDGEARVVSTVALAEAGLTVAVDRRGRATLRGARRGVDRAALRRLGVTYVKPSAGRKAHLRRLRVSRPSARR